MNGKPQSRRDLRLGRRALLKGLAAGAAFAGAGILRHPARAQAKPLKVGVLLPRSGYLAQEGRSCQFGAEIAPAVLADLGHSVEIVSSDWESKLDLARTQAEKMIDEGANLLVGAFDSGASTAIAQVCEQRGVPFVVNIAAAPQITEQGYKTVFRNFPSAPMLVRNGLAEIKQLFAATGQSPKKAVFMHVNDTFGQAMENGINKLFPTLDMGFAIVADIAYDPRAQDLSVEVAKAQASGGDFLLAVTHAGDAIKLIREMVKQRYDVMGVISPGSPGMYDAEFFRALGKYADYCISNLPWTNPTSALSQEVETAFKKRFPERVLGHGELQRGLHLRGRARRRRRGEARRLDRQGRPPRRAAQDQYRRARDHRRPDLLRRQGPDAQHRDGLRAEPRGAPGGGIAEIGRRHRAGLPGAELGGAGIARFRPCSWAAS